MEEVKEVKKETAAEIVAREKSKVKPDLTKRLHFNCSNCHVRHYGKVEEGKIVSIYKKESVIYTGHEIAFQGSRLVELLCLKCGRTFYVVDPMGKAHIDLKIMSAVWD